MNSLQIKLYDFAFHLNTYYIYYYNFKVPLGPMNFNASKFKKKGQYFSYGKNQIKEQYLFNCN